MDDSDGARDCLAGPLAGWSSFSITADLQDAVCIKRGRCERPLTRSATRLKERSAGVTTVPMHFY